MVSRVFVVAAALSLFGIGCAATATEETDSIGTTTQAVVAQQKPLRVWAVGTKPEKALGNMEIGSATVAVGLSQGSELLGWIRGLLDREVSEKDASLYIAFDGDPRIFTYTFAEVAGLEFVGTQTPNPEVKITVKAKEGTLVFTAPKISWDTWPSPPKKK